MADAIPLHKRLRKDAGQEASSDERLAFERLLFDLSSQFANLVSDRFNEATQTALERMREFLAFDRSSFAVFLEDGSINILATTAGDGVPPMALGTISKDLEWYHRKLRSGEIVILQQLPDDLPSEAIGEAAVIRSIGLRSHVSIPLSINGRLFGMIAFAAFQDTRRWPVDLIGRVRLLGEIIAQAYERIHAAETLMAALAEVKSLKRRLEHENAYLRQVVQEKLPQALTSHSPRFQAVVEEVGQVAHTNTTVLLLGETGSGKEVLAQAIHDASARKDRPMVKVNCAALPATLIESELFGREKGAFTGAIARQSGRFEIADG
jgi:formate hydrogenlyase transcriptional activator